MNQDQELVALSEAAREQALARFHILEPFLIGHIPLSEIGRIHGIPLRTLQRWAANYRRGGLAALARKPRTDRGQRRVAPEIQRLIEGLALQKTRPSAAAIHRQVAQLASSQGWRIPCYRCVYDIVHSLDPGMVLLAHEGSKAYQNAYDLVHRREASGPNAIWQADHSPLDIYLLNDAGQPAKPWLTIVEDDYSRCIAGYFLAFTHPNVLNTALTLRQAI
jgi:putative transposase